MLWTLLSSSSLSVCLPVCHRFFPSVCLSYLHRHAIRRICLLLLTLYPLPFDFAPLRIRNRIFAYTCTYQPSSVPPADGVYVAVETSQTVCGKAEQRTDVPISVKYLTSAVQACTP